MYLSPCITVAQYKNFTKFQACASLKKTWEISANFNDHSCAREYSPIKIIKMIYAQHSIIITHANCQRHHHFLNKTAYISVFFLWCAWCILSLKSVSKAKIKILPIIIICLLLPIACSYLKKIGTTWEHVSTAALFKWGT